MDGPIDDFLVLEFDGLMGLDQLWNIALNAASEVVFKESMTLLVALYQKVNDTKQFNAVRKSFVDRCMERLQLAHQQISSNDNVAVAQNQVDRLIFMLKVDSCFLRLRSALSLIDPFRQNFLQESKAREEKRSKEGAGAVVLPSPPKVEAPPKNIPQVKKVQSSLPLCKPFSKRALTACPGQRAGACFPQGYDTGVIYNCSGSGLGKE